MTNLKSVFLFGLCLVALPAVESTQPAGEAVALYAACELDTELLQAGEGAQPLIVAVPSTNPEHVRQALAHALGCWYAALPRGGYVLTRSPTLPAGPLSARVHPSTLPDVIGLEPWIRRAMAPWLGAGAGLAANSIDGSWVATCDTTGHAALIDLLTALERPGTIPAQVTVAIQERALPELASAPWAIQAQSLSNLGGIDVSVAKDLSEPAPTLPIGTTANLVDTLRQAGIPAAWCAGVLCIGGEPIVRQHPGQRLTTVILPVTHLGPATEIADAVRATWPAAWAEQPGFLVLARGDSIVIHADPAGIHAALNLLAQRDASR